MPESILYSFRRCPYAMRARLAIAYSQSPVQLREVVLRHKPQALLDISTKATVPVLHLDHADNKRGHVIDESLDIMLWALKQRDADQWLMAKERQLSLIEDCDLHFKPWLDKYKYADRHPEYSMTYYRQQCGAFLGCLEAQLAANDYLYSSKMCLADAAIFPFVRQFAHIDKQWFMHSPYHRLQSWYQCLVDSALFVSIMTKYPPWQQGQTITVFPESCLL